LNAFPSGAHCSYSTIQTLLGDVMKLRLSTGQLARLVQKASAALNAAYQEVRRVLPLEALVNVGETGHKKGGKKL
jgi:hypothetical protein